MTSDACCIPTSSCLPVAAVKVSSIWVNESHLSPVSAMLHWRLATCYWSCEPCAHTVHTVGEVSKYHHHTMPDVGVQPRRCIMQLTCDWGCQCQTRREALFLTSKYRAWPRGQNNLWRKVAKCLFGTAQPPCIGGETYTIQPNIYLPRHMDYVYIIHNSYSIFTDVGKIKLWYTQMNNTYCITVYYLYISLTCMYTTQGWCDCILYTVYDQRYVHTTTPWKYTSHGANMITSYIQVHK